MTDLAKVKLPENLKPFFWSYNFDNLYIEKHKKLIIVQIVNYGTWNDWKWLVKTYGQEEIKKFIEKTPVSEFRPGALRLLSLLLDINKFFYAPRGAY